MDNKILVETDRLYLRDLNKSDLRDLGELCFDTKVTKYLDYIRFKNITEVRTWLNDKIFYNQENPRHSFNLAIIDKLSSAFLGWIGIGEPSDQSSCDLDFGFAIKLKYWRKGYASEALAAIIDYSFKNLPVHVICGECNKGNVASNKVMQKVGLRLTKTNTKQGKTTLQYVVIR